MNNRSIPSLLPPLLIGAVSALGLCLVVAYVLLPRPNAQAVPTETTTPFKYMLVSTETPIVRETPPTEELALPVDLTSEGMDLDPFSATEVAVATAVTVAVNSGPVTPDSRTCTPAPTKMLEAILMVVASMNANSQVTTAWVAESNDIVQLTVVGARIRLSDSGTESTSPGVWGLIVYEDGGFDTYAINDIAQQYSYAANGSNFLPALTMATDGAQFVYNCALGEP